MCLKPERLWQVAVSSSLLCCRCRSASRSCCMAAMRQDSMPCPTEKHVQSASCWDVVFFFLFVYVLLSSHLTQNMLFPTCQVRVVRFYVSLFSSAFSSSASSLSFSPCPSPCRTSTTILWVQCGVSDLNRELVSSVWRAGPQPRAREFSVACRTPTTSSWVQCGVPDPNREPVSWVWRAGPQLRSCEFSVARRTPTAIMRVQCGVPDLNCDRKDW